MESLHTPPADRLIQAPTYSEKHKQYLWLLLVLFLVVLLIIVFISTNKTNPPTQNKYLLVAPTKPLPTSPPTPASRLTNYQPTIFNALIAPTLDPNCALTDYTAETADWKTYANTKYNYSFKYPKDATTFFNNHSNAPEDYE